MRASRQIDWKYLIRWEAKKKKSIHTQAKQQQKGKSAKLANTMKTTSTKRKKNCFGYFHSIRYSLTVSVCVCVFERVRWHVNKENRGRKQHTTATLTRTIANDQKTAIIHTTKVIMIIMPMSIFFFHFSLFIRSFVSNIRHCYLLFTVACARTLIPPRLLICWLMMMMRSSRSYWR